MPQQASIAFIPFQVETYQATTPENIFLKGHYKVTINSDKDIRALTTLLRVEEKTAGKFDKERVRLAVTMGGPNQSYLVDAEGNVLNGKREYALGTSRFERLKNLMSELMEK